MGVLYLCIILTIVIYCSSAQNDILARINKYKKTHGGDSHRCGICPTYHDKLCAVDENTGKTYLFDNTCVRDLYNCIYNSKFEKVRYDRCIFIGNFAYVHGYKYEDEDYGESFIEIKGAKKYHDFILE